MTLTTPHTGRVANIIGLANRMPRFPHDRTAVSGFHGLPVDLWLDSTGFCAQPSVVVTASGADPSPDPTPGDNNLSPEITPPSTVSINLSVEPTDATSAHGVGYNNHQDKPVRHSTHRGQIRALQHA